MADPGYKPVLLARPPIAQLSAEPPDSFVAGIRSINSDLCLEVPEAFSEPLERPRQADCVAATRQRIEFFPIVDKLGVYGLRFLHGDRCLAVSDSTEDPHADGLPIVQSDCTVDGSLPISAQFRLQRSGVGRYAIITEQSSKAVDVEGRSKASGTMLQQWKWLEGDNQIWELIDIEGFVPAEPPPYIAGSWSEVIDFPHVPVSAANLPDGRLLTWASREPHSFQKNVTPGTVSAIYDPRFGYFTQANNYQSHDMFCSGISLLEDGTIHTAGGNPSGRQSSLFSPSTGWQRTGDMNNNRWYGTTTVLPDGNVFATHAKGAGAKSEVYSTILSNWQETPGATMAKLDAEQIAINGQDARNPSTTSQWYAYMHVAPDGRVFHSGPTPTMHWFDTRYKGGVASAGSRDGDERLRMFGSSVMYDKGKLLITGGNDRRQLPSSSSTAFMIDIDGASPEVSRAEPMNYQRVFHNSVVLPTGEVMVVGGNTSGRLFQDEGSVLTPELWNPDTDTWRMLADMDVPRNYHSVAVLLDDGRVFAGGGGLCGADCVANHADAQMYSPPYLFNEDGTAAARPSFSGAPDEATVGDAITVTSEDDIAGFSMIRLSGVTHGINTDQRFLRPSVTKTGEQRYELELEKNVNVLIPGNYWLFALDTSGVPSVAQVINIRKAKTKEVPGSFRGRLKSVKSGKCVGIQKASLTPSKPLRQVTCRDLPEQTFDFMPVEGEPNTFTLKFLHSGQCLDVQEMDGGGVENGTDLIQYTCATQGVRASNQRFRIDSHGLGQYRVVAAPFGKVLDLRFASNDEGALIQLWTLARQRHAEMDARLGVCLDAGLNGSWSRR